MSCPAVHGGSPRARADSLGTRGATRDPSEDQPVRPLSGEDVEALGDEFDAIREEVLADLGEADARYIRRVIAAQRRLEAGGAGRCWSRCSRRRGSPALRCCRWPRSSRTWRSATTSCTASGIGWAIRRSIQRAGSGTPPRPRSRGSTPTTSCITRTPTCSGKDRDLGYSILRIEPDQPWHPVYLAQPIYIVPMALLFEWAIAIYDVELDNVRAGKKPWQQAKAELGGLWRKARKQLRQGLRRLPAALGSFGDPGVARQPHRERRRATSGRTRSSSAGTSPTARRRSPRRSSTTRPAAAGTSASCSARATSTGRRCCT